MVVTGSQLCKGFISGANNIANHRKEVDALNVFPVPDGDTGTNMTMTVGAAKRELEILPENATAGQVAQTTASALLRGARGNSGVILSLLFRGFSTQLKGKDTVSAADLAGSLEIGVEGAYKAVMKPTEGTILTVARLASEEARKALDANPQMTAPALWDVVITAAAEALAATPEQLPVLKKAGVVDAGGKGLLLIFEGIAAVLSGGAVVSEPVTGAEKDTLFPSERNAAGEYEGEITFTYCTEFIVLRADQEQEPMLLREYLESIGDSAVVVDDEDIIKCHVHTDNPGDALQRALAFGGLTKIKIENMREQHADQKQSIKNKSSNSFPYAPVDPSREYGFVAVAAGEGVKSLFTDLGVDNVVSGGQTMNPSTDDLLEAIHATPAKTVIVMPNNKNIIMAAEQATKMADRDVFVLPTRTIPQGLGAMLAFNPEAPLAENQLKMVKATERIGTGLITFAARDSSIDGDKIKKGELLALENGKISFTEKDMVKAVVKLVRSLIKKDSTFVTLIYGADVSAEQAREVEAAVSARLPDSVELALIEGGQPVYYYIISVE
ncbi:DAK2 domain-containing protein [Oscillospiraceae bacterium MB08-C2-2]|nr:DAK2 domain-containing protein [Oscillospiraceae bacterium MB08-C2-2]